MCKLEETHRKVRGSKICEIENCGRPYHANGFCAKHYQRWWRHGDPLMTNKPSTPSWRSRAVRLWKSSLSGREIAEMLEVAPITIYAFWVQARKAGQLPLGRRPPYGF